MKQQHRIKTLSKRSLFLCMLLNILIANEFIFSYKAISKNNVLVSEQVVVSQALTLSDKYNILGECQIPLISTKTIFKHTVIRTIEDSIKHDHDLLSCINKFIPFHVLNDDKSIGQVSNTKSILTIDPMRFKAREYDGNLIIQLIESTEQ